MNKNRFYQLLESKIGNVMPLLIVENDPKIDNFLKKYQDKTINLYRNPECTEYDVTGKIVNIKYLEYPNNTKDHYLSIEIKHEFSEGEEYTFEYSVECNYNPSKFSNKFIMDAASELLQKNPFWEKYIFDGNYDRYNKSFVNDIFNKGSQLGIQFCKKPNADFGMTNSPNFNLA